MKNQVIDQTGHGRLGGLCALVVGVVASATPANMIAGWHFNDLLRGSEIFKANEGTGVFSIGGATGGWTPYQGTLLNGADGWVAGESVGIRSSLNNGLEMLLDFDGVTVGTMTLSLAAKRSSTGFTSLMIEVYQPKGWIEVGSRGLGLEWGYIQASIPLAMFDDAVSRLRLTITGATSSQGTARFDNLRLEGNVIPGPGSAAVMLSGCLAAQRRRRIRSRSTVGSS